MELGEVKTAYRDLLQPVFGELFRMDDRKEDRNWIVIILDGKQEDFISHCMVQTTSICIGAMSASFSASDGMTWCHLIPTAKLYWRVILTPRSCPA